jgi:hypothetical protein
MIMILYLVKMHYKKISCHVEPIAPCVKSVVIIFIRSVWNINGTPINVILASNCGQNIPNK